MLLYFHSQKKNLKRDHQYLSIPSDLNPPPCHKHNPFSFQALSCWEFALLLPLKFCCKGHHRPLSCLNPMVNPFYQHIQLFSMISRSWLLSPSKNIAFWLPGKNSLLFFILPQWLLLMSNISWLFFLQSTLKCYWPLS